MTIKLGLYIVAALFIVALFGKTYQAGGNAREAKLTAKWQAQYDKQVNESRAKEEAQRNQIHEASTRYEQQIETLRNDVRHVPIVSVPKCPRRIPSPQTAAVGSEPSKASNDELDRENGRASAAIQFSNGLREYASDCQAIAIQLKEVIGAWPN